MLDTEYKLLSYIKANQPCAWIDVLNAVRSDEADVNTLHALLSCAIMPHGWIEKTSKTDMSPLCRIRLTATGEKDLLAAEEKFRKEAQRNADQQAAEAKRLKERAEDRADEERRYRAQNKIAVFMPIITFVLGIIVEHHVRIIHLLVSFFQ